MTQQDLIVSPAARGAIYQSAAAVIEQPAQVAPVAPYKVDTSRGSHNGAVSSQWFARPADQRYTSLTDLYASTLKRSQESRPNVIDTRSIRVTAERDNPDRLAVSLPDTRYDRIEVEPSHYAFGQMSSLLGVPAGYLRKLPAPIAAINLQYAVSHFRQEMVKSYVRENGALELRALTGPDYGRIHDHEVVSAVRRIAGDGTGRDGSRWKIPGVLNWQDGTYNPEAEVTAESTTLFASDRDVFLFLVDDRNPIEIGKLRDGSPDLAFRGFYVWNSEVGAKTFGIAGFLLRGVCQNRNLWGVEGFQELRIRHSKNAPDRFMAEAAPAIQALADSSARPLVAKIERAKDAIVAKTDDERREFLGKRGFSRGDVTAVLDACLKEEGKPAESVWDFVNGITAAARSETHQDERIEMERRAANLMAKV